MAQKNIPAISVIIPMYNTEKYVGECLDSLLAQNFQDFEVIVIDDCSTDNSVEIVEGYAEKFGGKLQLVRSKINSGGCAGIPRNTGLRYSRGEYIFFMDSDDVIVPESLQELYAIAKHFAVDVVHCEKYYTASGETATTDKNFLKVVCDEKIVPATEPTLVTDDLAERVKEFGEFKFLGLTCNRLIHRNLIADNNIEFPALRGGEDHIFSFYVLCLAKNIIRAPKPYYVWRNNSNSLTHANLPADKLIHRWIDSLFRGAALIDNFMNQFEVLKNRADLKYAVFNTILFHHTNRFLPLYSQIPAFQLDFLIRRELAHVEDKTALTAFIFSRMNSFNVQLIQQQRLHFQYQAQIQRQQEQIQNLQEKLQHVKSYLLQLQNISQDLVNKMNQK